MTHTKITYINIGHWK